MMGRALVIGTLCIVGGIAGLTQRADAQSADDEDEEDMSTGEITEEVSTTDSISDDTSTDDDLSDDSSAPDAGNHGIPRPKTPLQPTR
jgi:hypothetical protein